MPFATTGGIDARRALDGAGLGGALADFAGGLVAGGGFANPDGRRVEAPDGTAFFELALSPAEGSRIRVEVALPPRARWCGRLVGLGSGGQGGRLPYKEQGAYLRRGCATATTDLGTQAVAARAAAANAETVRDFGHRATHLAMVAGRALAAAAYGGPPRFVYFVGGSTGGQQGMSLAQRHPEDCDAVIAAVPAHSRTALHAYFLWNWQASHRGDGSMLFNGAQEKSWRRAALDVLLRREAMPRARGRFASDPRWGEGELSEALALAATRDPTLSPAHLEALRRMHEGPVHAITGARIHGGIPPASDLGQACGNLWLFDWVFGAGTDPRSLDFGADYDRYRAALAPDLDADSPDLDAFRARGGKMLVYSGSSDSCVPWHATAEWYGKVAERYGAAAARAFCLYYVLPGRSHVGGPGVQTIRDEFRQVVAWREKGVAPRLVGHGCTAPAFDVPLSPF